MSENWTKGNVRFCVLFFYDPLSVSFFPAISHARQRQSYKVLTQEMADSIFGKKKRTIMMMTAGLMMMGGRNRSKFGWEKKTPPPNVNGRWWHVSSVFCRLVIFILWRQMCDNDPLEIKLCHFPIVRPLSVGSTGGKLKSGASSKNWN